MPIKAKPGRPRRSAGDEQRPARERILDAAEQLFGERGYHAVSLREITALAGAEVALANYYFGPKEDLFREVVSRRIDEHCLGILATLNALEAEAGSQSPSIEAIIHAFCAFSFRMTATGGDGWKNYFHLLSRSSLSPLHDPGLAPVHEPYGKVIRRYARALGRALPDLAPGNLAAAFYYLQASLTRLLAETDILEAQSNGLCPKDDFDGHLARIVPFFAAGFRALAGCRELGRSTGAARERAIR